MTTTPADTSAAQESRWRLIWVKLTCRGRSNMDVRPVMNAGILSSSAPAALRPQTECYHCGLPLPRDVHFATTIDGVERVLCCARCQAVAQIIVDHGLISYYRHRSALPARGQTVPLAVRELAAYDVP